ncbi:inositol transporter-like SP family MFS transporter [Rathayibacter sp. PhB152]|uniref:MFS transporter n=1 Tax=Rathayibacter sp. PhB152 TaxID=2485190 RepID=UPI000F4B42F1|nr:MFS transporter [Rathayibacter sp. PhB152]ROQ58966.1 inositol transporter-like SP family MFS transporter [Rathayibacter sp. PhB152]
MSATPARREPSLKFVAVVCGLASYLDAAGLVSTGLALAIFQTELGITADQFGVLIAALTLFVGLGSAIGGRLGDRFGRRRVFTVTMVLIIIGATMLTFGASFPLLIAGIIIMGTGIGADLPVSLATISEAATERNRGGAVVFSHVLWTAGILVTLAISTAVGNLGLIAGQILFGQIAVIAVIVLILRLLIPESTLWLQTRGISTITADRTRVRDLFRGSYLVPFLVLAVSYSLLAIGAGTLGGFGAFIAVNLAGVDVALFSAVLLGISVLAIGATLWFMRVVDTRWRMTYFAVGAVMMTAGYALVAILGFSLPTLIAGTLLSNIGMCFAFETLLKVWMQESFPTQLRSTAQGTIMAIARLIPVLVQVVTPSLLLANGQLFYAGLAVITALSVTLLWFTFRHRSRSEFSIEEQLLHAGSRDEAATR